MFTLEKIAKIHREAEEKKWPFHYLFNSLKSIGIERVETNVTTNEAKYVGEGTSLLEMAAKDFRPAAVAPAFNADAVKVAIEKRDKREVDEAQFLAEIAAAGVSFFRVDMKPRTVTYHGAGRLDKHVEKIAES